MTAAAGVASGAAARTIRMRRGLTFLSALNPQRRYRRIAASLDGIDDEDEVTAEAVGERDDRSPSGRCRARGLSGRQPRWSRPVRRDVPHAVRQALMRWPSPVVTVIAAANSTGTRAMARIEPSITDASTNASTADAEHRQQTPGEQRHRVTRHERGHGVGLLDARAWGEQVDGRDDSSAGAPTERLVMETCCGPQTERSLDDHGCRSWRRPSMKPLGGRGRRDLRPAPGARCTSPRTDRH